MVQKTAWERALRTRARKAAAALQILKERNLMADICEKIRKIRQEKGMTQQELADRAGITKRTVASYESEGRKPHPATLRRIAQVLGVTSEFLKDDSLEIFIMPPAEILYIENIRASYGDEAAEEVSDLLTKSRSLLAGGTLSQEAKDSFFLALTNAYIACRSASEEKK